MNEHKIAFIYAVNDLEKLKKSKKSIDHIQVPVGYEIEVLTIEGADSIFQAYNIGMKKTSAKYKVYIHQDVNIQNLNIITDVLNLFNKYPKLGIIGAIGAKYVPLNGVWYDSKLRYGKVNSSSPKYKSPLRDHVILGDYEKVQAVDGLIIITQYDIYWREDLFKGWHFYETSQCFEFLKAGYEVGVPRQDDPWFEHDFGNEEFKGFEENREVFLNHYRNDIQRLYPVEFDHYFGYYMELVLEFIELFKELTYNSIPLAILIRFERYIDEELYEYIISNLTQRTLPLREIQPNFNRMIDYIKQNINKNLTNTSEEQKKKKTVIYNSSVLRFPANTFNEFFNPNNSVILEINKEGVFKGIKVQSLSAYSVKNSREITTKLVEDTKSIFETYPNHPLFGNGNFQKRFINEIPEIIKNLIMVENYFKKNSINCIIVGQTGDLVERIIALFAAVYEIPCICTQHGLIMGKMDTCYFPVFAKKQAVFGEYEKEYYLQFGVQEENIEIIGHPRFDSIFNQLNMNKYEFSKFMGVDPNKKIVLIVGTPDFDFTLQFTDKPSFYWSDYVEYLVKNDDIEIIIKPTYWEFVNKHLMKGYLELCSRYTAVKILGINIDLYNILPFVDVVAVENSTVGMEAMLFEKQTVCLAREQSFLVNTYDYYSKLGCFFQIDAKKLAEITNKLLAEKDFQILAEKTRSEFLKKAYTNKQELSGKLLIDLVAKLTGEHTFDTSGSGYEGCLIKGSDHKIYFVEKGMKRHIISPAVFNELGFKWKDVKFLSNEVIEKIPTGFLIKGL